MENYQAVSAHDILSLSIPALLLPKGCPPPCVNSGLRFIEAMIWQITKLG